MKAGLGIFSNSGILSGLTRPLGISRQWLGRGAILLPVVVFGFLWFAAIKHLSVEWSVNPQYTYGWAVPFLCAYLIYERIAGEGRRKNAECGRLDAKAEGRVQNAEVPESARSQTDSAVHGIQAAIRNPQSAIDGPARVSWLRKVSGLFSISAFQLFSVSAFCSRAFQRFSVSAFVFLAFLYFPTRLLQEANPEWWAVGWLLALITLGLTLIYLHSALDTSRFATTGDRGQGEMSNRASLIRNSTPSMPASSCSPCVSWLKRLSDYFSFSAFQFSAFVFPLCFFLVAVPWPAFLEEPLIQTLTRANTGITIELLSLWGIAALQHGNVIEIATGVVGIDEACSGIRSFQATLMISLFFGELYRLTVLRRVLFVLAGFILAFVFNIGRTFLLVSVASSKGIAAIESWHDPAGVTILVACFVGLWLLGQWLGGQRTEDRGHRSGQLAISNQQSPVSNPSSQSQRPPSGNPPFLSCCSRSSRLDNKSPSEPFSVSAFQRFSVSARRRLVVLAGALCAWLVLTEISVEAWYRSHELQTVERVSWAVQFPTNQPSFNAMPIAEKTARLLRFDDGRAASWDVGAGQTCHVYYFRWNPGKVWARLVGYHNPAVCLTASGLNLVAKSPATNILISGWHLPYRQYTFAQGGESVHVFHCIWQEAKEQDALVFERARPADRLKAVLAGHRNLGQRVLEIALWGLADPQAAEAAFRSQLEQLIVVEGQ